MEGGERAYMANDKMLRWSTMAARTSQLMDSRRNQKDVDKDNDERTY